MTLGKKSQNTFPLSYKIRAFSTSAVWFTDDDYVCEYSSEGDRSIDYNTSNPKEKKKCI
jgi:hypothetical protein